MVMIIVHISYITCLATSDSWHIYAAIGVYQIHLGESHNSRNRQYRGWLVGHGRGLGLQHLTELTILWLARTVMGEVVAHNRRHAPGQNDKTFGSKTYYFYKLIGTRKNNSVMVMFIIHIAYITCLVTNDAWHTYDVIGVYMILHGVGQI